MTVCELAIGVAVTRNAMGYNKDIGAEGFHHPSPDMTIIEIKGKSYEVHNVKPYFYAAGTTGNVADIQGETLIVRQVRSKKFWMVNRYQDGTYSKLIA